MAAARPSPFFSVIIPAYNCASFIGEAIASVLSQTYRDFEVIVVDDGSTDCTWLVLDPHINRGEIRYIQQENAGPATARNTGIRNAIGKYIVLLDADDLLYDTCLEALSVFLRRCPEVDFLFTNYDIFDETGVINNSGIDTWRIFRTIPHRLTGTGEWVFTESLTKYIIRYGGFMHTSGTAFRRTLVDDAGDFREGFFYGEDDEFYARATYRHVAGYIDCVLSRKRNHPASLIHSREKQLRNVRHYLNLTEHQSRYFPADREISRILRKKLALLAYDYAWGMQMEGHADEAREAICHNLRHRPSWPLFRLLVKHYLMKFKLVKAHA